ncbi:MAG: type I secretion system permease/ATPase [Campylobacterales bacterium]|nr:type I secretion system permease/ATPase [Campylobacterales bacterium]
MQFEQHDPLLQSLVIFTQIHNVPMSAEALVAGLPIEPGGLMPELFSVRSAKSGFARAAARAGFKSRLVKKELRRFSPLLMPVILLLREHDACILLSIDEAMQTARIIVPEVGAAEETIALEELEARYLGYAFLLKQEYHFDLLRQQVLHQTKQHWFWGTMARFKEVYIDVLVASLLINLFVLATPLFTLNVYDRVIPNNATGTLWTLATGVLFIYLMDTVLRILRSHYLDLASQKGGIIIASMMFEKVLNNKLDVKPKSVGYFAQNLKDFEGLNAFASSLSMTVLIDLPFAIIFLAVIGWIAGIVVLVPLITVVLLLLNAYYVMKVLKDNIRQMQDAHKLKNGILIESLSALETIKTLGTSGLAQWRWEETNGDIALKNKRLQMRSHVIRDITDFLTKFNTVVVVVVSVYQIQQHAMTMGALLAVMILTGKVVASVRQIPTLLIQYESVRGTYKELQEIMDMPVEKSEEKSYIGMSEIRGDIVFDNVSFAYRDEEKRSLRNLSFTIKAGEKVAIVGRMGSGKSTLLKLIMKLYEPQEGSVLVDGIDINQIEPADLRKNIIYVPQNVMLFNGTLRENIAYRAPHVSDSVIVRAAQFGGCMEFVNRHPKGFEMLVGEKGENLSGGQKQTVGIARAFLVPGSVILLDEPTNSMDGVSEKRFLDHLKTYLDDQTMIVISHKHAILELVDRIIVLDNGKIVMDGSKEQILGHLEKEEVR